MKGSLRFLAAAFLSGVLFAVGLALSGMTLPSKIIGFFDFSRGLDSFDPSLALVMAGALLVYVPVWLWVRGQRRPFFDDHFEIPSRHTIDAPLIVGAALFGVGWGLSGFCPGPAFVSLGARSTPALWMAFGMVVGMLAYQAVARAAKRA